MRLPSNTPIIYWAVDIAVCVCVCEYSPFFLAQCNIQFNIKYAFGSHGMCGSVCLTHCHCHIQPWMKPGIMTHTRCVKYRGVSNQCADLQFMINLISIFGHRKGPIIIIVQFFLKRNDNFIPRYRYRWQVEGLPQFRWPRLTTKMSNVNKPNNIQISFPTRQPYNFVILVHYIQTK